VQVDFTPVNLAKKEVLLTVEAERVSNSYRKYLVKSAGEVSIPGFRKGKAPLSMVERSHGEKIRDYFTKDFVDEVFTEATKEHDIQFLLYPEIKEINWEPGQNMTIKIEIEVEPEVSFTQIEGLRIPYKPLELDDEVEHYIEELRKEYSTMIDVDDEIIETDEVEFEVKLTLEGKELVTNYTRKINIEVEPQIAEAAIGKKIGDTFVLRLPHNYVHYIFKNIEHEHQEGLEDLSFMINAIRRQQLPTIDDEFAKDLEFDSVQDMKDKIIAELAPKNELKNYNIRMNALISKLYIDNIFDLPEKAIQYLAEKELDQHKITEEKWRKYYELQIRYQITQDFINMYLMKGLRKEYAIEPSEEDIERYIEHEAKLNDQSTEDWKQKHKSTIVDEDFKETVVNYLILNKIAQTCDYYVAEDNESAATELIEQETSETHPNAESNE